MTARKLPDLLYSETERDLSAALSGLLADRAAPADIIAERVLGLPHEPRTDTGVAWKDLPR